MFEAIENLIDENNDGGFEKGIKILYKLIGIDFEIEKTKPISISEALRSMENDNVFKEVEDSN